MQPSVTLAPAPYRWTYTAIHPPRSPHREALPLNPEVDRSHFRRPSPAAASASNRGRSPPPDQDHALFNRRPQRRPSTAVPPLDPPRPCISAPPEITTRTVASAATRTDLNSASASGKISCSADGMVTGAKRVSTSNMACPVQYGSPVRGRTCRTRTSGRTIPHHLRSASGPSLEASSDGSDRPRGRTSPSRPPEARPSASQRFGAGTADRCLAAAISREADQRTRRSHALRCKARLRPFTADWVFPPPCLVFRTRSHAAQLQSARRRNPAQPLDPRLETILLDQIRQRVGVYPSRHACAASGTTTGLPVR